MTIFHITLEGTVHNGPEKECTKCKYLDRTCSKCGAKISMNNRPGLCSKCVGVLTRRERRARRKPRFCAMPDCDHRLGPKNTTGICMWCAAKQKEDSDV